MTESEILEKTKALSIEQRLHIISAIWQTIDHDMKSIASTPQISPEHAPLRGKVTHYNDPYEPIAATDWEALPTSTSFGESIVAFRQKHNIEQLDLNPDEIWGNVRDKSVVGQEVSFE